VVSKRIKQIRIRREELKRYYNKKYILKEFKIGDKVLLSIKKKFK